MAITTIGPPDSAPVPAAGELGVDADVKNARSKRRRTAILMSLLWGVVYYGFAMGYYTQRALKLVEDDACDEPPCYAYWNVVDALYFATVTMTTTGYGDLKPLSVENRAITLLFLLVGMVAAFPAIATAIAPAYQFVEMHFFRVIQVVVRATLGKGGETTLIDLDGDGLADYEEPSSAIIYYVKGISSWLIIWLISQVFFALG
jgi:nitrate reductase NapE component